MLPNPGLRGKANVRGGGSDPAGGGVRITANAPQPRRGEHQEDAPMRRLTVPVLGALLALSVAAPAAFAGSGTAGCWGTVSAQRSTTFHDTGEHSSSFAGSPRLGLGNVARLILGEDAKVGDLGAFLASVDGLDETYCG